MRTVVTGGAGFIGSHLIEALVARGDEVTCLERRGASRRWVERLPIRWLDCGLDDADQLAAIVEGADVVFHLAGLTRARSPAEYYQVNTVGTARLADAIARHRDRPPRLVLLSSLAATGPNRSGELLSPTSIPYPVSHYGHSKLMAEEVIRARADRVPAAILRLPSVYGPRECGVLEFFRLVRRGLALTVGRWDRELSMLFVSDAVQGIIAAGTSPAAVGRTYCLAHPAAVTWAAFAGVVGDALGRRPLLVSLPSPVGRAVAVASEAWARLRRTAALLSIEKVREIGQARWVCDPSRAIDEIGFRPNVGIGAGAAITADWYRGAGWL